MYHLRACWAVLALTTTAIPMPCYAEVQRFGLVIGNNVGDHGETELRYAESDSHRVYLKDVDGFPLRISSCSKVRARRPRARR
jgi:hypothetical protein